MKFAPNSKVWICSLSGEITHRVKGGVLSVDDTGYSILQFEPIKIIHFPLNKCTAIKDGQWLEQRE